MIVRFQAQDIPLSDELYAFAMDELTPAVCALRRVRAHPVQLDVQLTTVASSGREKGRYRVEASVALLNEAIEVRATGGDLYGTVREVGAHLRSKVHARTEPEVAAETSEESTSPDRGVRDAEARQRAAVPPTTLSTVRE